jgi:serine/threonine-protein kinase
VTDERRQQVEDLFEAALDEPSSERAAWLAAACGNDNELRQSVEELIAAHERPMGALDRPIAAVAASILDAEREPERHIGPYRVLRELGRGGMGVVYLAERDDGQYRRRVAIKVVRSGFDDGQIQRRFLAERQILASLSHPNIAQLLDGGVTDGQLPYLVMEYVDGQPLTAYCDLNRLGVEARLRLFLEVCAAVRHAHQNLVIHRDLKPANIVVDTTGRVKLLDFGIAKLLNPSLAAVEMPLTRLEHRVMTLDYASPEQVRGDALTTASDVYSLGVILYELVCGHRPYRTAGQSPEQIVQLVCTNDPERPSSRAGQSAEKLARQLRGDVDAIVMMALRKEPARRYRSAGALGDDIERHFARLPVMARQGSRRYLAGRFLRRRRLEVTAVALVAAALLVGAGLSLRQASIARHERDRATAAQAQAEEVTAFVLGLFSSAEVDPSRPTGDLSVRDLLRRGVARVDALADQPLVQARLFGVIGGMQHNLGEFDEAIRLLDRAVAIRRTLPDRVALADTLLQLSWVYRSRGDGVQARRIVQEVVDIRRTVFPPEAPEIADAVYELGFVAGNNQELEVLYREALAILERTGARPEQQLRLRLGLTTSLRRQGRFAEALESDRRALDFATREFGAEHFRVAFALAHLGDQLRDLENDLDAAEQMYRRSLDLFQRARGPHHMDLIHPLDGLATVASRRGHHVEAERFHREIVRIRRGAQGERHPFVALALGTGVAVDLERQGRLAEAEATARESLDTASALLGPRHPDLGAVIAVLARIKARERQHDEADRLFRESVALKLDRDERLAIHNGEYRRIYGRYLIERRRFDAAEAELLESLRVLVRVYGNDQHPNPADTKRALMELYEASGQPALVERYRVPPGTYYPY